MSKIKLSLKEIMNLIILGIRLGNTHASIDLAQDVIDILDQREATKQKQATTTANKKDKTIWGI
jgi:hypothetical protein